MSKNNGKSLKQLIQLCRKLKYVNINEDNSGIESVAFLPLGKKLKENIKNEWETTWSNIPTKNNERLSKTINEKEYNSFIYYKYCRDSIINALEDKNSITLIGELQVHIDAKKNLLSLDDILFRLPLQTVLSCSYIIDDMKCCELFYKLQAQRKIWWMKFSANPGRFFLSEVLNKSYGKYKTQTVSIKSKFSFGNVPIETIDLIPYPVLEDTIEINPLFGQKVRKSILRTSIPLEQSTIGCIMDALDTQKSNEICLNKRIAPIHCGVYSIAYDENNTLGLTDLRDYIVLLLKKGNIAAINCGHCKMNSLDQSIENLFVNSDAIGVPYCLLINDNTLETGLLKLRNRDTTLTETVHVSDIPKYLQKIVRS